jgi:hypothetical protein
MDASKELLETYAELERIYQPFSEDGKAWKGDVPRLQGIVERRDKALSEGAVLMRRISDAWPIWESQGPDSEERARVFSARNRIVELGLAASRANEALQARIRRKADELRMLAADIGTRQKATMAYGRGRRLVG